MTAPLPNRSEPLPEKRYYDPSTEENWADILHNVLEEISVNSLVSGTDHTDFEPVDGQLFVPTNGGKWYLGDGETWNEVATSGSGGAALGGKHSTTGDGTTTHFEWSTGVADPADLEYAMVDAASSAASTDFQTYINGTNIGVEYARAPADGATLEWFWSVNTTVADSHTHEGDDLTPTSVTASSIETDSATVTNGLSAGSVGTDALQTGADVSQAYGKRVIDPGVSDVGAAINSAIAELAPRGGVIELPKGIHSIETTIDLNDGVNGQTINTPIRIVGHGATHRPSDLDVAGTILDASSLSSGPVISQTNTRRYLQLENFVVKAPPGDDDAIKLTGNSKRGSRISHVMVDGDGDTSSNFAFNLSAFYGGVIDHVYAYDMGRGVRAQGSNACRIGSLIARNCNSTEPAVVVEGGLGFTVGNIYSESNAGAGLSIAGYTQAWHINSVYFEGNNSSGSSSREIVLGDTNETSGVPQRYTIGSIWFGTASNAFGSERFTVDDTTGGTVRNVRGEPDLYTTTARGDEMRWDNCSFGTVDTTNASGGGTWLQPNITGTDNRHAGHIELTNGTVRVASGSASNLPIEFAGGAGLYVNSNGEIVAVDEAGNESILT